jgi:hypothetical protein
MCLRVLLAAVVLLLSVPVGNTGGGGEAEVADLDARAAFGWSLLNGRRFQAAAVALAEVLPALLQRQRATAAGERTGRGWEARQQSAQTQQQVADTRLGLARALNKLGRRNESLEQLGAIGAAAGQLPPQQRAEVQASVAAERGAVLACAGRLGEAIEAKQDGLLALDKLMLAADDAPSASSASAPQAQGTRSTQRRFAAECAELSRIMLWAGRPTEAAEVASMAVSMGPWATPLQLPAGQYVPGLAAHPWHSANAAHGASVGQRARPRRLRKSSRLLRPGITVLEQAGTAARLAAEFASLFGAEDQAPEQTECLHTRHSPSDGGGQRQADDDTGAGRWRYVAVWGKHSTSPPFEAAADGSAGCNQATPQACRVARQLLELHGGGGGGGGPELVRLGYSLVERGTHIRPHFGPTNTQLKAHLGLVVPRGGGGGGEGGSTTCTAMRVGTEQRTCEPGVSILYMVHSG